jgi:hypothetical protein
VVGLKCKLVRELPLMHGSGDALCHQFDDLARVRVQRGDIHIDQKLITACTVSSTRIDAPDVQTGSC